MEMLNGTSQNGTELDKGNLLYAVVYGCIMTLGLPLNAVALWILVRHHGLKSPNAIFLVNLAISDLLLVISLILRVHFYSTGTWQFGNTTCISVMILFTSNLHSSAIFITFISVDRLLAVVYPLRSRHLRTAFNAGKATMLAWLFVVVMIIPMSVEYSILFKNLRQSTCFEYPYFCLHDSKMVYVKLVFMLIMLAVNIVATVSVSWTLHTQVTDRNKINLMLIFAVNLVIFTVCLLPVSLVALVKPCNPPITLLISLASVNCCLDPLFYYFSFDGFWKRKENVHTPVAREVGD